MPLLLGPVRCNSAAGPGARAPSFPRKRVGGAPSVRTAEQKNRTRSYMNGNGELTETENVIFYVSYRVITEFLRMNVIFYILLQRLNGMLKIRHSTDNIL